MDTLSSPIDLAPAMVVPNNATILTIRNRCRQPAPDLQRMAGTNCYVAYFEGGTGNQWIFARPDGSAGGALYGSSVNWQPREVTGAAPADLTLDEQESAWLQLAWAASTARQGQSPAR